MSCAYEAILGLLVANVGDRPWPSRSIKCSGLPFRSDGSNGMKYSDGVCWRMNEDDVVGGCSGNAESFVEEILVSH